MVVKMRTAVGVAMIWVATVACVSVTAWVAIDRAGRDITSGVVGALPPVTLGPARVTTTPQRGPSRTGASQEPSATPAPSRTPKPTGTLAPSARPEPSATSRPTTTSQPFTTSRDRTLSVAGGQVSVRCTEATIRLRIAQPDDGWRVEVENAGPEAVDVIFRRGEDDHGGGSRVTAVCTSGTPTFKVEADS